MIRESIALLVALALLAAVFSVADRNPASAEIMTVQSAENKNITGTYRKYDSGRTPVIVVLEGSGVRSQDSAFLASDDLSRYNMYVFNSTSPNGRSFSIATYYKSAETFEAGYCRVIAEEVKSIFPDAGEIGLVSYSAGGYGANGVARSLTLGGTTVSWAAGYDNVPREEMKYKTFDDYIKKLRIPSMLCLSTDQYRTIAKNSRAEAEAHPDDYTVIQVYDGSHAKFVRTNSANISTGSSLFSDLARFAEENFK